MRVGATRALMLALLMLGGITLTGCASDHENGDSMRFEDARAELAGWFDEAERAVPGDWEWVEFGARRCTAEGGGEGATMQLQRTGPGVPDGSQRDAAAAMSAVFADAGFEVTLIETEVPGAGLLVRGKYPAEGTDATGLGFEFGIGTNGSSLTGTTRCGLGDPERINEERRQEQGG